MHIRIMTALAAAIPVASIVAAAAAEPSPSVVRVEYYGTELPASRVLPVRGPDLPINGGAPNGSKGLSLSPQVQAIPTPTAFQAGLAILLAGAVLSLVARQQGRPGHSRRSLGAGRRSRA